LHKTYIVEHRMSSVIIIYLGQ